MPLTPQMRSLLKRSSAETIAGYVAEKRISLSDLASLAQNDDSFYAKYCQVVGIVEAQPKPEEIKAYNEIKAAVELAPDDPDTYSKVCAYIQAWEQTSSAAQHVSEAKEIIRKLTERGAYHSLIKEADEAIETYNANETLPDDATMNKFNNFVSTYQRESYASEDVNAVRTRLCQLQEAIRKKAEAEWNKLLDEAGRLKDINDIKVFMRSMTVPVDILERADDKSWEWVKSQADDVMGAVHKYEQTFNPAARRHQGEVEKMHALERQWQYARTTIPNLRQFLSENPGTPFEAAAQMRIKELTDATIEDIRRAPQLYTIDNFMRLLDAGLDGDRLLDAAGLTEEEYEGLLKRYKERDKLPAEPTAVTKYDTYVGERGVTDIVFFGISSSGKTCVLSGLLRDDRLRFDRHLYSGEYGETLYKYALKGFTLSGTPKSFVATIKAEVIPLGSGEEYHFNLFEMSGEDFYDEIALHKTDTGYVIKIEDMGAGAAEILKSENDKVFFIVMDPTEGALKDKQRETIEALVDLLFGEHEGANPNEDIMGRVQGLHFIVTKSDMLPAGDMREEARTVVRNTLKKALIETIIAGCRKYGINVNDDSNIDGRPRVFPFSLGKFTIGNMFTYDARSSHEILQVICDYCTPRRKAGVGYKIRNFLTKPII